MKSLFAVLFLAISLSSPFSGNQRNTLVGGGSNNIVSAFMVSSSMRSPFGRCNQQCSGATFQLRMSGKGIAKDYTWTEEAFEIEVTVPVPKDTRASDIAFKATPTSIDLRLNKKQEDGNDLILLDPTRNLRGRVVLDGTYWVISDPEEADADHRLVTVTIEKQIRTPKDDFDVIDYDWNGVYSQEEEDEVSYRKYDEPEKLDVREYAASLGVDIDNINMSMVDKTMFSSGLNLTQSSMDSLKEAGMMKEVTRQSDGTEWVTDNEGDRVPFSSMGKGVTHQEIKDTGAPSGSSKIPFLDTASPWHKTVPVDKRADFVKNTTSTASATGASFEEGKIDQQKKKRNEKKKALQSKRQERAVDPIGALTVARLKEILRSRGLKISGNKKELQDRLREEVSSMLDEDITSEKEEKSEPLSS